MKIGEKLTFVNFMKKITDGLAKIIFRQDVMGGEWGGLWGLANVCVPCATIEWASAC